METVIALDIHKVMIEQSKQGMRSAQHALYQQYAKAMFNTCFRMLNSREEAEDLLQEAFSDAFQKLATFRYESTFGAWLKRIVVNKCINHIKRRKMDLQFFDDMEAFDSCDEDQGDGFDDIENTIKRIRSAMEQLPRGSRMVFSLHLLEGFGHEEVGRILGVSESTSKTQYMRAKNKIKEILNSTNYETR